MRSCLQGRQGLSKRAWTLVHNDTGKTVTWELLLFACSGTFAFIQKIKQCWAGSGFLGVGSERNNSRLSHTWFICIAGSVVKDTKELSLKNVVRSRSLRPRRAPTEEHGRWPWIIEEAHRQGAKHADCKAREWGANDYFTLCLSSQRFSVLSLAESYRAVVERDSPSSYHQGTQALLPSLSQNYCFSAFPTWPFASIPIRGQS